MGLYIILYRDIYEYIKLKVNELGGKYEAGVGQYGTDMESIWNWYGVNGSR